MMWPTVSVPHPRPRARPPALALLRSARQSLADADEAATPAARYASAHLAALRASAAVLATRARPTDTRRRKRPRSVWALLPEVAPALGEWADFFAMGADKRAAAEAGLPSAVSRREADDLVRDAETYVSLVESSLAMPYAPRLPMEVPRAS
ncbi:MAG: SAV_6107 family HEPN domain-containing protein [Streptosporangiaceae bacterium]